MSQYSLNHYMIKQVAEKLGCELLSKVAFVGGCTTGLHITDNYTKESIRYTEDVDLIVHVQGYTDWHKLSEQLIERGLNISMEDEITCRFRLGSLCVDFMPDDEKILGFSNQWYQAALAKAEPYSINEDIVIRLITPCYFLATKFEAYKGRGKGDLLASRDMEDILNIIDGREELLSECRVAEVDVRAYLANAFKELLQSPDIQYAVQSTANGDTARADIIFERIETLASY